MPNMLNVYKTNSSQELIKGIAAILKLKGNSLKHFGYSENLFCHSNLNFLYDIRPEMNTKSENQRNRNCYRYRNGQTKKWKIPQIFIKNTFGFTFKSVPKNENSQAR